MCACVDVLHCVDLGVCAHVIANVFQECIRRDTWGRGTFEGNAQALEEELKRWYNKHKKIKDPRTPHMGPSQNHERMAQD